MAPNPVTQALAKALAKKQQEQKVQQMREKVQQKKNLLFRQEVQQEAEQQPWAEEREDDTSHAWNVASTKQSAANATGKAPAPQLIMPPKNSGVVIAPKIPSKAITLPLQFGWKKTAGGQATNTEASSAAEEEAAPMTGAETLPKAFGVGQSPTASAPAQGFEEMDTWETIGEPEDTSVPGMHTTAETAERGEWWPPGAQAEQVSSVISPPVNVSASNEWWGGDGTTVPAQSTAPGWYDVNATGTFTESAGDSEQSGNWWPGAEAPTATAEGIAGTWNNEGPSAEEQNPLLLLPPEEDDEEEGAAASDLRVLPPWRATPVTAGDITMPPAEMTETAPVAASLPVVVSPATASSAVVSSAAALSTGVRSNDETGHVRPSPSAAELAESLLHAAQQRAKAAAPRAAQLSQAAQRDTCGAAEGPPKPAPTVIDLDDDAAVGAPGSARKNKVEAAAAAAREAAAAVSAQRSRKVRPLPMPVSAPAAAPASAAINLELDEPAASGAKGSKPAGDRSRSRSPDNGKATVTAPKANAPKALPKPSAMPAQEEKRATASRLPLPPPVTPAPKPPQPPKPPPPPEPPKIAEKTVTAKPEEPKPAAPKPAENRRVFDWNLLAKIDILLLGTDSGFFANRQTDGSRIPGKEPQDCESSGDSAGLEGSEDEDAEPESSESEDEECDPLVGAKAGAARGAAADDDDDDDDDEEEEEEDEEDDAVVEKAVPAPVAASTTRPKAKSTPAKFVEKVPSAQAPATQAKAEATTKPKLPPTPPPKPSSPAPKAKVPPANVPAMSPKKPSSQAQGKAEEDKLPEAAHEDDDFNDEEMMAAFAAKLQGPSPNQASPSPESVKSSGAAPATSAKASPPQPAPATRAKAQPKAPKANTASILARKRRATVDSKAADDKDKSDKAEVKPADKPSPKEPPPPPFFDQWLASLKFIAGWNDQRKYQAREVKEAFNEHLESEAIFGKKVIEQLCRTIVPLLMDLESVDSMVVAHLKKEVLRTLKIVQVCILRIVTFELCREQTAKASVRKKAKGAKAQQVPPEGQTYLASDISSLAKVVGHFRFDPSFAKGLHQLILAIRRSKKPGPKAEGKKPSAKRKAVGDTGDSQPEKGAGESAEKGGDKGSGDKAEKSEKRSKKTSDADESAQTRAETKPAEDKNARGVREGDSEGNSQAAQSKKSSKETSESQKDSQEPPKKKPRMVS
eukprot:TRINITY_DN15615_c1_g2_i1.p1 TRINITY_DN15615_c1_g2~~TRINITY_DN15615_c1_g2_i1.p1  ORF type:complete len:1300 (+),score=338.90 TRINITY_DN15615_c1_g2_i1:310-3900(+)